ncbi:MAG: type II secretion system GspH family protein [Candidatus Omnitrophica bacterium]|nr:type II secretion system GspH family protein [Candidatus Omnitrophota bacterium]
MQMNRGVTLLELVVFIIVAGIALPPLLMVASQAVHNAVVNEIILTSTGLAEGKMEEIKLLNFDNVGDSLGTFSSPFGNYSFSVSVGCVTSSNYDNPQTCQPTDNYKRVAVTVSNSIIPQIDSTLVTIITKR